MKVCVMAAVVLGAAARVAAGVLAVSRGDCASPAEYLEKLRDGAANFRAADPSALVRGGGAGIGDDFATQWIAFGESEEVDEWAVENPTPERVAKLRKLFDGAGGKAVALVDLKGKPLEDRATGFAAPRISGKMEGGILAAGTGRVFIAGGDGAVVWERRGCGNIHCVRLHDVWVYYSNGSLYRCRLPGNRAELVWRPESRVGGGVLGFDIAPDGNLVMAINSTGEVVELDGSTLIPIRRFKVNVVGADGAAPGAHGRLRMIRKTAAGTYLVCAAGARTVREYGAGGRLIWEQEVPVMAFDALIRANGNVVVSHLTGVTEYSRDHRAVWSFKTDDAPELQLQFLCGVEELANGNLALGTWANGDLGSPRATACEIDRGGKAVWALSGSGDVNMMTVRRISPEQFAAVRRLVE